MFCQKFKAIFWAIVIWGGMSSLVLANMEASEKDASVRKLGVAWNIAEDRKMENISGVYEPEGLDKYVKRYFDQLSAKVDRLSVKIEGLSAQVEAMQTLLSKKGASKSSSQGQIV